LYLRNDSDNLLPCTVKVRDHRPFHWGPGVLDPAWRAKLAPYLKALKTLIDAGLTAAAILMQCHHQRVVPLMERALLMAEGADPNALAWSRQLAEPIAPIYATQRARRVVDTRKIMCNPDEVL
jgi:hypothetical protein